VDAFLGIPTLQFRQNALTSSCVPHASSTADHVRNCPAAGCYTAGDIGRDVQYWHALCTAYPEYRLLPWNSLNDSQYHIAA
jgi:hypothetical protein